MEAEERICITPYIVTYREFMRKLWNNNLSSFKETDMDWDLRDACFDIGVILFDMIVSRPLDIVEEKTNGYTSPSKPMQSIFVEPADANTEMCSADINNGDGAWKSVPEEDRNFKLLFVDIFDFDQCEDERKFEYVEAEIIESQNPKYMGWHVLIKFEFVRFFLNEDIPDPDENYPATYTFIGHYPLLI